MMPNNVGGQEPYGSPYPSQAPQYPPQQQQAAPVFQAPQTPKSHSVGMILAIVVLLILFIVSGSLAIWAYSNYTSANNNVQEKIDLAKAAAQKDQANADETNFAQREKQPNLQFVGPDNYGRVTFSYPKTWSAYVSSDVENNGGTYQAYLNPGVVPPISATSPIFALRVIIQQMSFQQAIQQYQPLVQTGQLKSSSFSANGHNGTRLDGNFTTQLRGSMVLFQIRDKVLIVRTDANTFDPDFENIIKTINFNS